MPPTAATAAVNLVATGDAEVISKINKVGKAGGAVNAQFGTATRTMANFGASMAQAGTISATSLGGIVQQTSMIAFSFGPAGALVGAVATAGIAIATMFRKSSKEAEDFGRTLRRIAFDGSFSAAFAKQRDIEFQLLEAQRKFAEADAKMNQRTNAYDAIKILNQRSDAEEEITRLTKERAAAAALTSGLALREGERQKRELEYAKEKKSAQTTWVEKLGQEADQLSALVKLDKVRGADIQHIEALEKRLTDALARGNLKLAERAVLSQALAKVHAANVSMFGFEKGPQVTPVDYAAREKAPKVPVQITPRFTDKAQAEWAAHLDEMAPMIQQGVQQTFGTAIEDGFTAAFTGKNPLKAFGKTILKGLGQIFMDMGRALLGFGKIMAALQKFIMNPLTSGPASIAAGVALIALGAALTSIAGGGGGGGAGGGSFGGGVGEVNAPAQVTNIRLSSGSATQAASNLAPPTPVSFTVIGAGDPKAQRDIADIVVNAQRRGLL